MKICHMKIHLPLARFDCPYAGSSTCGRAGEKTATSKGGFTREDYYVAHLKRVHGVDGRRGLEGGTETLEKIIVKRTIESGQGDTLVDSVNNTQHQHSQPRALPAFLNHGSSQDQDLSPFSPQDISTSQNPYPNSDTIIRKTTPFTSSDFISTVPEFSHDYPTVPPTPPQNIITPALYSENPPKIYTCMHPGCIKSFKRYYDLQRHMATHFPSMRFDCPYARSGKSPCGRAGEHTDTCKGGFPREDHLVEHLRNVHGENIPRMRRPAAPTFGDFE